MESELVKFRISKKKKDSSGLTFSWDCNMEVEFDVSEIRSVYFTIFKARMRNIPNEFHIIKFRFIYFRYKQRLY